MSKHTNQSAFKVNSSNTGIKVPGVTLFRGYAWLSVFSFSYLSKIYKSKPLAYISNLRIVSMNPSNPRGLLDVYDFSKFMRCIC